MDQSNYIIDENVTVLEAMSKINSNLKGIVYIVDDERRLTGSLTDGDIRRYILQSGDLKKPVKDMLHKNPKSLKTGEERKANSYMKKNSINSVPILDEDDHIIKIRFWAEPYSEEKKQLALPVVIMAGGKGTRLAPYTNILPKPLIPIGDKTITEHIMYSFIEYGCTHFDIILNYKKNLIKSYFLDNEIKLDVDFVEEKEYLGTGGGLKYLDGKIAGTFFMSNCDILVREDYSKMYDFHKEHGNVATMICAMKNITIPYGTVEMSEEGYVSKLIEKPEMSFLTNTGLYILEPEFVEMIPKDTFIHTTDVLQLCIDKGMKVGVYPIAEEKWLDMGQLSELENMKNHLGV
jgi:dTDP-glucose pyrophosphorylase